MLIQEVTLTALQVLVGEAGHNVKAFVVGTPNITVPLRHGEVPLADIADGLHEDGGLSQRGLDERIRQRGDPPQPLALPVQVHEEDSALELVPARAALVPLVLQGAELLFILVRLAFPLGPVVRVVVVLVLVVTMVVVVVVMMVMAVAVTMLMRAVVCDNHSHEGGQYHCGFNQCSHLQ